MFDSDLLENEINYDDYHKRNLICDEIMHALNIFPIFDASIHDDVSEFLWHEYHIYVDFNYHVYCPELFYFHLQWYFERDLDFPVDIVILFC